MCKFFIYKYLLHSSFILDNLKRKFRPSNPTIPFAWEKKNPFIDNSIMLRIVIFKNIFH